ncbi:MAG: hypothetical protein MI919_33170, partial [Holophagales bacterium]|nr:hypothetical protein [Holophagales bacterium]
VGTGAETRSRLLPRNVHDRFWEELSLDPLSAPFPAGWRNADLAHAQLEAIWDAVGRRRSGDLILVVPGDWPATRLGLLLGVAASLGMPVAGLIDTALAELGAAAEAGSRAGTPDPWRDSEAYLHLDLHLHRAVVTRIGRGGSILHRQHSRPNPGLGVLAFRQRWLEHAAARFLRETRFDPLHRGENEQELWLALPEWLGRLCGAATPEETVEARLDGAGGDGVALELRRSEAEAVAGDLLEELRRGCGPPDVGTVLVLSATAASIPGLAERLGEGFGEVARSPASAAAVGALEVARQLEGEAPEPDRADEGAPYLDRLSIPDEPRERGSARGQG